MYVWMAVTAQHLWAASRYAGPSLEAMQVEVVGEQFQWYFRYPGRRRRLRFNTPQSRRRDRRQSPRPRQSRCPRRTTTSSPASSSSPPDARSTSACARSTSSTVSSSPACASRKTPSPDSSSTSTSRPPQPEPTPSSAARSAALGHERMQASPLCRLSRRIRHLARRPFAMPCPYRGCRPVKLRLFTTHHRTLGILYLLLSLAAVAIGTLLSLVMRIHRVWPDTPLPFYGLLKPEDYLALVTMHGTLMIFFVLTIAPQIGFANLVLPEQIGARSMAFPRLNAIAFWIAAAALLVLLAAFFVPKGAPISGWTSIRPLSAIPAAGPGEGAGMDLWLASIGLFCLSVVACRRQHARHHPRRTPRRNDLVPPAHDRLGMARHFHPHPARLRRARSPPSSCSSPIATSARASSSPPEISSTAASSAAETAPRSSGSISSGSSDIPRSISPSSPAWDSPLPSSPTSPAAASPATASWPPCSSPSASSASSSGDTTCSSAA